MPTRQLRSGCRSSASSCDELREHHEPGGSPDEPEALGLLALMLLTHARAPGRTDADGAFIGLADQQRSDWDRTLADEGHQVLRRAIGLRRPGPFQLQAMIASLHMLAPSFDETDWPQIAELYGLLAQLQPSPVIDVKPRGGTHVRRRRRPRTPADRPAPGRPTAAVVRSAARNRRRAPPARRRLVRGPRRLWPRDRSELQRDPTRRAPAAPRRHLGLRSSRWPMPLESTRRRAS